MARLFLSAFQECSCHPPECLWNFPAIQAARKPSQHFGSISHDDDVIIRCRVGQLFIADAAAKWVAECLISSSALQTGKLPVCVCNLLVCEHSTVTDYAEKTHFTYSNNTTATWLWAPQTWATGYTSWHTFGNRVFVMSQRATTPLPGQVRLFHLDFWQAGAVHGDAKGLSSAIISEVCTSVDFVMSQRATAARQEILAKRSYPLMHLRQQRETY